MPKVLLSVSHQQQHSDGDCLTACAAMAVDYYKATFQQAKNRPGSEETSWTVKQITTPGTKARGLSSATR